MRISLTGITLLGLASLSMGTPRSAKAADRAVVVGVNEYLQLSDGAGNHPNLNGPVNDARQISELLHNQYGFEVTLLTNQGASKQGILDAIRTTPPAGRFVFYFAGHGYKDLKGKARILPSDANDRNDKQEITASELNQAVKSVTAANKIVLLDSCFSGGMSRSFKGTTKLHPKRHSRYFQPINSMGSRDLVEANDADINSHLTDPVQSNEQICYFTASRQNEQAGEDYFPAQINGVFTHFLIEQLKGKPVRWSDLQTAVSAGVREFMEDMQNPTITAGFVDQIAFGATEEAPPVAPHTCWDDYNADRADAAKVRLELTPNQTSFKIKERFHMNVHTGMPGYLVLIERGTSGNINLLFPRDRKIDSAYVQRDQDVRIPADSHKNWYGDGEGFERVKAILFSSQEGAESLIKQFPDKGVVKKEAVAQWTKDLRVVPVEPVPFSTSDIIFEITPEEVGK